MLRRMLGKGGSGAALWTPAELGADVEVWLKPFDTDTITYSAGVSISVADQSGNSHDFEKTSGTIPTSGVETVDGNNAIGFNGGEDEYLRSVDNVVFRGIFFFGKGNTVANPTWASMPNNMAALGGSSVVTAFMGRTSENWRDQGGSPSYSLRRTKGAITTSCGAGNCDLSVYPDFFNYFEFSSNTANSGVDIGEIFGRSGRNFEGFLGELILFNTTLSSTDYEKVEGYASWRSAGDGSYLPIGHPYKNEPPTV